MSFSGEQRENMICFHTNGGFSFIAHNFCFIFSGTGEHNLKVPKCHLHFGDTKLLIGYKHRQSRPIQTKTIHTGTIF